MRMKYGIVLLALLMAQFSCQKYQHHTDDLKGLLYLHGRLQILDTVNMTGPLAPQPFGGATVQIGYLRDSAKNYLYSVKADSNGYFTFTNLSADSSYIVFCKTTKDSLIFYQQRPFTLTTSVDTSLLTLYPSQKWQNGLVFDVQDKAAQPVTGCQVCLFLSQQLFNADTCNMATYVLTSNPFGAAVKLNVPAGTYYARFTSVVSSKLTLTGSAQINVSPTGISKQKAVVR